MRLKLFRDNWEQFANFAVFNLEIKSKIMKVTAFIRKTAKKNDIDTKATIYFRLRDGKKDIKAASELVINPNHWSVERQGYKDRVALVPENEKMDLNHKVQALTRMIEKEYKEDAGSEWLGEVINSHPEEYDRFVAEVNSKSAIGLQKVFKLGWKLTPQMMRKYQDECHGDLADEHRLQSYSADTDAARLLVGEFRNLQNDSIAPAMLAWLYYGKCYETMVTQLEAETHNPTNNFFEKR